MMMLSDRDIRCELDDGGLSIDPFDPELIQPASVDVRLDTRFRLPDVHDRTHIDPLQCADVVTRQVEVEAGSAFVLHPGEFVLASTFELITVPDTLAARLEGKSSLGRLGLLTHATAGFIDPGFSGQITLELANIARLPIMLWPGMKIGQLCLYRLSSAVLRPYGSAGLGSRYQGQRGPTSSRGVS